MEKYNIVWTEQSCGSEGSMPLGGHDTGCNVWVENNSLYLYISQSGTFDENNTMLKLARLQICVEDNREIFSQNFRQELHLEEGYITVQAGDGAEQISFRLWASVVKSEINIEFDSCQKHKLKVVLENWRYRDRDVAPEEYHQCRDYDRGYTGKVVTRKDIVEPEGDVLYFYHKNQDNDTVWHTIINQQHLEKIKNQIPNPLFKRIMGGRLEIKGAEYNSCYQDNYRGTDFFAYVYMTKAVTNQNIKLTLHTACCDDVEQWKSELCDKAEQQDDFNATAAWWKAYFEKSYIKIDEKNEDSETFRIGRNYQLFRYMLGCNYYGEYPTKFNGGLFTFDTCYTPDFRRWSGGGFTLQNQRLVYWGMLKTGDFEGMKVQLDYFKKLLPAAKARVKHFFDIDGAFFFEQGNIFGACIGAEYGWNRSPKISEGLEDNPWVRLHLSTGLEFALMMLEYSRYSGETIDEYMEYIDSIIEFYMNYYGLDDNGKLCVFPSSALETYKGNDPESKDDSEYGCKNPTDAVAGLRCVLEILSQYAEEKPEYTKYVEYLEKCPEIATGTSKEGNDIYLPAEWYNPKPINYELPQLYRIFPYSPYGLTEEEVIRGRNTYFLPFDLEKMYLGYSWHQNGIFAARLGLFEEAWKYLKQKLDNSEWRFPAFWGPGHDWTPDHNHGGSGMIELQEMLMQCDGEKIRLFPCWDKKVDVTFKLHAPLNTVVECQISAGKILCLNVTPVERMKDIEIVDID